MGGGCANPPFADDAKEGPAGNPKRQKPQIREERDSALHRQKQKPEQDNPNTRVKSPTLEKRALAGGMTAENRFTAESFRVGFGPPTTLTPSGAKRCRGEVLLDRNFVLIEGRPAKAADSRMARFCATKAKTEPKQDNPSTRVKSPTSRSADDRAAHDGRLASVSQTRQFPALRDSALSRGRGILWCGGCVSGRRGFCRGRRSRCR